MLIFFFLMKPYGYVEERFLTCFIEKVTFLGLGQRENPFVCTALQDQSAKPFGKTRERVRLHQQLPWRRGEMEISVSILMRQQDLASLGI